MSKICSAKFQIGQVVKHRLYPFRGVVFDIDPVFDNTVDEWHSPSRRGATAQGPAVFDVCLPRTIRRNTPSVSEQNLLAFDTSGEPLRHPQISEVFVKDLPRRYRQREAHLH